MTERFGGASDFGFSLMGEAFHSHWRSEGSDVEVLADYLARNPAWLAESILVDALRLEAAGLPAWQIEALWSAATHPFHDLRREGHDGRDWLRRIVRFSRERLRTEDSDIEECALPSPYSHLTGAVLDEILLVSVGITEGSLHAFGGYVPGVVPALNQVAAQVCPDLAFRLLLRALAKFGPRISQGQYDRYVTLGKQFEYGELLVDGYDHLMS
ncbi:hypothetical protein ACFVHB_28430 [Kitasatospora sp. NPDC127111]|uniref:hypothetical protein n=1 Tax=Kitasatospora sp. NPDC127111 TaxID=3345363 RepID=UPI003643B741